MDGFYELYRAWGPVKKIYLLSDEIIEWSVPVCHNVYTRNDFRPYYLLFLLEKVKFYSKSIKKPKFLSPYYFIVWNANKYVRKIFGEPAWHDHISAVHLEDWRQEEILWKGRENPCRLSAPSGQSRVSTWRARPQHSVIDTCQTQWHILVTWQYLIVGWKIV